MAKYTMTLRDILYFDSSEIYTDTDSKLDALRAKIFDFNYTLFGDDEHKKTLERMFCQEYWLNEIGFESVELFKWRLENWFRQNIDFYNKLYQIAATPFDVTKEYERTTSSSGKVESTSASTSENDSNSTADGYAGQSDTPQGKIDDALSLEYLSGLATNHGTDTSHSTGSSNALTDTDTTSNGNEYGHSKSIAQLEREYYEAIRNIDREVVIELGCLFMGVF